MNSTNTAFRLDFLVIGAGRSGTTWIWRFLRNHPQCFVPEEKELHYFNEEPMDPRAGRNPNFGRPLTWYHSHFASAEPLQIKGEVSPGYLWSQTAPELIYSYRPDLKLVASLRDPVERSFSHFLYRKQRGNTGSRTFEEEIERFPFVVERSFYGQHLQRYLELFPRSQLKILLYDDLAADPRLFAGQLQVFLGLRQLDPDCKRRVNPSGLPRHPLLARVARTLRLVADRSPALSRARERFRGGRVYGALRSLTARTASFEERPAPRRDTVIELRRVFAADIELLEVMLGLDLTRWKAP
jgi:hypothetical protein